MLFKSDFVENEKTEFVPLCNKGVARGEPMGLTLLNQMLSRTARS